MLAESNARYLSLALDARKIIDALILFVKETDTPRMETLVGKVLESLNASTDRERIFSSAQRRSLFGDYERMQTLEEVQREFPTENIGERLQELLRNDIDAQLRKKSAEQAIQFFCALEGRALERYTQAMDM
jgi:hypothetical protein